MNMLRGWKRFAKKSQLKDIASTFSATTKQLYNRWVKGSPVESWTIKASATGKHLYNQRIKGSPAETFAIRTTNSTRKFIKHFYINWRVKGIANKILNIKVKNQFDPTVSCTIGDLCIMGYITESNILDIARCNGIEFPSEAVDFSENNIIKYLYYHGKDCPFTYYNETGEKVISGITKIPDYLDLTTSATPIITKDHLESLITTFQGNKETWNSVYGHLVEHSLKDQLHDLGYKVEMPSSSNYVATDLFVEKKFFIDKGLQYTESPDLPGFGLLQVKSTSEILPTHNFTANTLHHLETNPDIPVLCSSKIAASIGEYYPSRILGFSDIGIDDTRMEDMLYHQFDQLKFLNPHAMENLNGVAFGLDASVFSDAMDSARTAVFSHTMSDSGVMESTLNIGFHNIPLIGIAVRGTLSLINNLEKAHRHEISLDEAYANTLRETAKTAVVGTASVIGTEVVFNAMGSSVSAQFNGLAEALSDDNIGNIATSALGVAGVCLVGFILGKCASKIYDFFDPKKNLKIKMHDMNIAASNIAISLTTKFNSNEFLDQFGYPLNKLKINICDIIQKIEQLKRENDIYPISYYVAKRKLKIFQQIYKILNEKYEKISHMFSYLTAASTYLSLPLDSDKECKKNWKEITTNLYCDYNSNSKIKKTIKEARHSDEQFSDTIRSLINYDIDNYMPYIKKLNNNELNKLIAIFEQKKLSVQIEYDKLVKEGKIE